MVRLLLIFVLILSCVPKQEHPLMHNLEPSGEADFKVIELRVPEYLDTERIMYKTDKGFYYFAKNVWVCELSCVLENYFKKAQGGEEKVYLEVLDFYPVFTGKKEGYVYLRARVDRKKEYVYKIPFKVRSFEEIILKMNEAVNRLLEDVNKYVQITTSSKSISDSGLPTPP
ncbi:hypothetical protein [Aquifex aeolicus]|uniref:Uncharacterized protein aq_1534 n=1 Tax=Aquifex aeolicus (strain VF5) TaxID=224324 RepID=Y1534_AQUAE|nr:hypothetical protein [Aquifex aeolicus]O67492.1 RecName: Full=Uncharacterized protein aq_1534 [Aquifex aeolicus VF5]AAC07453.1 putative protein [Aquifex aeolicus VF5]